MAWAFSIWWGRHHTLAPLKTGPRDSCNKAPLDSLLAEAVGRTVEGVEARLAEVQQQLLALEPELTAAQQAVADARREFLAIDGTAQAAELREEAESLLAQMRHKAERYARLRLARSLLERCLSGYIVWGSDGVV